MDLTLTINQLFAEFATKYGLPSLALNQENVAALCFDDRLKLGLILVPERDHLVLQVDVAELHQVGEGIFRQLASFNRHWYQFNLHFGTAISSDVRQSTDTDSPRRESGQHAGTCRVLAGVAAITA